MTAKPGWMLPDLYRIESQLAGRWEWWTNILQRGTLGTDQIPQVRFADSPDTDSPYLPLFPAWQREEIGTGRQLKADIVRLFERLGHRGTRPSTFVEFYLWGFGSSFVKARPHLDDEAAVLLYQEGANIIARMIAHPTDWAAFILGQFVYPSGSGAGWFPTPLPICTMMALMSFPAGQDHRAKSVLDPCAGTGAMLLPASNHSVNLYANDIAHEMVCWLALQAYLYVPWLIVSGSRHVKELAYRPDAVPPMPSPRPRIQIVPKTPRHSTTLTIGGGT